MRAILAGLVVTVALASAGEASAETLASNGVGCIARTDFETIKADAIKIDALVRGSKCRLLFAGRIVNIQERSGDLIKVGIIQADKGVETLWTGDAVLRPLAPVKGGAPDDPQIEVVFILAALLGAVLLLSRKMRSREEAAKAAHAQAMVGAEIWEEHRLPRSIFGQLVVLAFVVFNGLMIFDLVNYFATLDSIRSQYRDNGFAQLGINMVANSKLNEIVMVWAVGFALLGAAVLGTRGKKQMVRRVA